jgi:hypothetical protein
MSAAELSQAVRQVDLGSVESGGAELDEDGRPDGPREAVIIRCSPVVNGLWFYVRQLARRAAGEPLPPWACAEQVAAEVLSALPMDAEAAHGRGSSPPVFRPPAPRTIARQRRDSGALARESLRSLTEGLEQADPFELDARMRRAVALEQQLDTRVGPVLRAMVEARLYRDLGFSTLDTYVRERLGMSPQRGRALVRLERSAPRVLMRAYREGEVSWVQAYALLPVLVGSDAEPFREPWLERARRVTVRRLRDDVEAALLLRETDSEAWASSGGLPDRLPPERQTRAQPTAGAETSRLFFVGPREVASLFRAVLCTVRRRIEVRTGRLPTPGEAFGWMLAHAVESWGGVPRRVPAQYRVFERDGWRCTVPGCSSRRNLHDHHIVYRSAGGSNDLANRTTLCAWHHLRGVHAGLVRCAGRAPDGLRFDMPLGRYRSGDVKEVNVKRG